MTFISTPLRTPGESHTDSATVFLVWDQVVSELYCGLKRQLMSGERQMTKLQIIF